MTQGLWPSTWLLPARPRPLRRDRLRPGRLLRGTGRRRRRPRRRRLLRRRRRTTYNEAVPDVGFDASAGYHTYGVQWIARRRRRRVRGRQPRLDGQPRSGGVPAGSWPRPTRSSSTYRWPPTPTPGGARSRPPRRPVAPSTSPRCRRTSSRRAAVALTDRGPVRRSASASDRAPIGRPLDAALARRRSRGVDVAQMGIHVRALPQQSPIRSPLPPPARQHPERSSSSSSSAASASQSIDQLEGRISA